MSEIPTPSPVAAPLPAPVPAAPSVVTKIEPVIVSAGSISKRDIIIACVILTVVVGALWYMSQAKAEPNKS